MSQIRCDRCSTVFESSLPACLVCGTCPGCGKRRLPEDRRGPHCQKCQAEFCLGCARCHRCGDLFAFDLPVCDCGHPADPAKLKQVEKSFALKPERGCLSAVLLALSGIVAMSILIYL